MTLQSPETQVRQALAAQDRAHLEDIYGWKAGGTLELVPVKYAEVVPDVEGDRATVVAVLDAEGKAVWRDQEAKVSYVGREQFHMKPCKIALWCAEGDQFARLRAVLRTLFRRYDAVRAGDPAALMALVADDYRDGVADRAALDARLREEDVRHRSGEHPVPKVKAWQIRVDRDGAEVGEDYEIEEGGNVRHRRARYRLERRGERWLFVSGL